MSMTNWWGNGYFIQSSNMVLLLSLFRVVNINNDNKVVYYSIVIFCLNLKNVNPTKQTLILLTPQWYNFFIIRCVDSRLFSLSFQFLPLFIFNHGRAFQFLSSCCPKQEWPNQTILGQVNVILIPNIFVILLQDVLYFTWSQWQHLSNRTILIVCSFSGKNVTLWLDVQ